MRAVLRRLSLLGLVLAFFLAPSAAAGTVAIFYYPWYGTPSVNGAWLHWNQNGHSPPVDLYSRYYPANGPYSTADPIVVDQQMAEIAAAGIDEVVISWWGRGSQQDKELPMILAAARNHHLQPAIHLEPYPGRSPATVAQDLPYLASLGITDVFVYHPLDFASSDWAALQVPPSMRLFAGTPLVGFAVAGHFAGIYTYDFIDYGASKFARLCAEAHAHGLLCGPSVGPGYDGRGEVREFTGAAAGDDGHVGRRADRRDQLQVETGFGAVGVHGVEQDLADAEPDPPGGPLHRVYPGSPAAAMRGHLKTAGRPGGAPGVHGQHHALRAEPLGRLREQFGAGDGRRVQRHLVLSLIHI